MEDYLRNSLMMLLFRNVRSDKHADINLASEKAYGDMARHTLHLKNDAARDTLKKSGMNMLLREIRDAENGIATVDDFDKWHKETCVALSKVYEGKTTAECGKLTYGQAQKWLNMTIKYLYIIYTLYEDEKAGAEFFKFAHVPIDSIMYKTIKGELAIDPPKESWSKLDDSKKYLEYQKKIRKQVEIPLIWEMENWTANSK